MTIQDELIVILNQLPAAIEKAFYEAMVLRHPGHANQKTHGNRFGAGQAKESLRRLKDDKGAREQYKERARKKLGTEAKPVREPGTRKPPRTEKELTQEFGNMLWQMRQASTPEEKQALAKEFGKLNEELKLSKQHYGTQPKAVKPTAGEKQAKLKERIGKQEKTVERLESKLGRIERELDQNRGAFEGEIVGGNVQPSYVGQWRQSKRGRDWSAKDDRLRQEYKDIKSKLDSAKYTMEILNRKQ